MLLLLLKIEVNLTGNFQCNFLGHAIQVVYMYSFSFACRRKTRALSPPAFFQPGKTTMCKLSSQVSPH